MCTHDKTFVGLQSFGGTVNISRTGSPWLGSSTMGGRVVVLGTFEPGVATGAGAATGCDTVGPTSAVH